MDSSPVPPTNLPITHPLTKLLAREKVEVHMPKTGVLRHITPLYKGTDGLCPCVRSRVLNLMGTLSELGADLTLIETLRASDRQEFYWKIGATRTLDGQHEPHPPNWLSLAADLAPASYLAIKNWNPSGPYWSLLGTHARALGFEWGGTWPSFPDKSHVQLKACICAADKEIE